MAGWLGRSLKLALAWYLVLALTNCAACGLVQTAVDIRGIVVDAATGAGIPQARIAVVEGGAVERQTLAEADGQFNIQQVKPTVALSVQAEGYHPQTVEGVEGKDEVHIALRPVTVDVTVSDSLDRQPVSGARLTCDGGDIRDLGNGSFQIARVRLGATITAEADGYDSSQVVYTGQSSLSVVIRPNTLSGTVADADSGEPISGARVNAGAATASTGADGCYLLRDLPAGEIQVKVAASGYDPVTADVTGKRRMDFSLRPFAVRAPYVTYFAAGDPDLMRNVMQLVDTTELNAVVIDIKGDRGWIAYKSEVPLAAAIGANDVTTIGDVDGLIADLKRKGIYSIARIVVFKDDPLARNGPRVGLDVGLKDAVTGGLWIDGESLGWVDPFREETWDYNIALAKEAALKGFDEVQFDYIRFPTDPSAGTSVDRIVFSRPNTESNRMTTIADFLQRAVSELKPLGVNVSVDVFGYTCWRDDDMGIGQKIELIGRYADFICPMVYPSTYSDGIPGYKDAVGHPYEIVYYSVKKAVDRLRGLPVKVRPWLQYFDDYPWASGRTYNAAEILTQKKAAADAGACGWQLWDPFVKYARGGIE